MRPRFSAVFAFFVLPVLLLSTVRADGIKEKGEFPEPQSAGKVWFELKIDGCSCTKHDAFDLLWDLEDGAEINTEGLRAVLFAADADSLLLCDCSDEKSEKYSEVIDAVISIDSGVRIMLKRELWLTHSDIRNNMETVFAMHRNTFINARTFEFYY